MEKVFELLSKDEIKGLIYRTSWARMHPDFDWDRHVGSQVSPSEFWQYVNVYEHGRDNKDAYVLTAESLDRTCEASAAKMIQNLRDDDPDLYENWDDHLALVTESMIANCRDVLEQEFEARYS